MRKACQILFAVLLVLIMPAVRADSADSVRIVSECIDNTAAGGCIIRVYAHGGSGIMGFRLRFSYPSDKLRVIAARKGSVTEKGTMTDNIGLNEGGFDLLWNNTEAVSAEGELAVISAEPLKTGEPFTVDVDFEQEDTFNEKWEDVVFECEPVFTADIAEDGRFEPTGAGVSADTSLIVESAMKDVPRGKLSDSEKQSVLERVNSAIGSASGESGHFADFGELSREYGRLLLDKLPEEAEKLPTDLSAAQIIADVLAQRGETEVSSDKEYNSSRMKGLLGILLFTLLHTVFIIAFFAANRDDISYRMVWPQMIFQLLLTIMIYLRYFNSKRELEFIRTEAELENAAIEAESNKRYYELAQNKYEAITSLQSHLCAQLEKADDMLSSDGTEEMASIIGNIRRKLDEVRVVNYCASNTVNSVLTIKLEDEAMTSIDTEIDLRDCDSLPLDEYELCSIIVNMFDNAVHCCQKLPGGRYIRLKSRAMGGFFIVRCENPCADGMEAGDSAVREGHGYGLKILGKMCEKYNGEFTMRYSDGTAVATAAVSLESPFSD